MTVRLFTAALILASLSGCPSPKPKCGDFSNFDLATCDARRASLAAIPHDGVWNYLSTKKDTGTTYTGSLVLRPGAESLDAAPLDASTFASDTVYLSSTWSTTTPPTTYRTALAACDAPSADEFEGGYQICQGSDLIEEGTFDARRVTRPAGEDEASHLVLRSETALPGQAQSVDVQNGIAYVASRSALTIIDVHNPAAPVILSQLGSGSDFWQSVKVNGTAAYIASGNNGVLTYDVSDPANPHAVQNATNDGQTEVYSFRQSGNTLFAASPIAGNVILLDATTPTVPGVLSTFSAYNTLSKRTYVPLDMFPLGEKLYISYFGLGLVVADISNPSAPRQLGEFIDTGATNPTFTQSAVAVQNGSSVMAILSDEGWNGHLRTVDASDPTHMTQVGEWGLGNEVSAHNLRLSDDGKTLYVAHYQNGLRVLDVSDPAHPVQTAYFNTWRETDPNRGNSFYDGTSDVAVPGDGHIYVTDLSRGLLILDPQ